MNNLIDSTIGTLKLEGFDISKQTLNNLNRYANGEVNYKQLLTEIKERYVKENINMCTADKEARVGMNKMQSAYSTYEKVRDTATEIKYLFEDVDDTLMCAITEDESETFYLNRLENWTVTADIKLGDLASAIEGLKIVKNEIDNLLSTSISELRTSRAKLEVIQKVVDSLK